MKKLISLLWIIPCSIGALAAFVLSLVVVAAVSVVIAPVAIVASSVRSAVR